MFWQAILFNNMFSLFQVKVYLIFSFIEISHTVRNTDNCLEPDNLIELTRKLARDNLNFHNSYYMLAPLRSAWEKKTVNIIQLYLSIKLHLIWKYMVEENVQNICRHQSRSWFQLVPYSENSIMTLQEYQGQSFKRSACLSNV